MHDKPFQLRLDPSLLQLDSNVFIAHNAVVIGDVHLREDSTVWFGAVVRGDTEQIRIGARTNLQDGVIIHADAGFPCVIGDDVTVGHRCVLHGARIGNRCMIGMSATVMNGAVVGEESIVGAGALVTEGKQIPPRSMVIGVPARVVRPLEDEEISRLRTASEHYVLAGRAYRAAGYATAAVSK